MLYEQFYYNVFCDSTVILALVLKSNKLFSLKEINTRYITETQFQWGFNYATK